MKKDEMLSPATRFLRAGAPSVGVDERAAKSQSHRPALTSGAVDWIPKMHRNKRTHRNFAWSPRATKNDRVHAPRLSIRGTGTVAQPKWRDERISRDESLSCGGHDRPGSELVR